MSGGCVSRYFAQGPQSVTDATSAIESEIQQVLGQLRLIHKAYYYSGVRQNDIPEAVVIVCRDKNLYARPPGLSGSLQKESGTVAIPIGNGSVNDTCTKEWLRKDDVLKISEFGGNESISYTVGSESLICDSFMGASQQYSVRITVSTVTRLAADQASLANGGPQ